SVATDCLIFTIINQHTGAITTQHQRNDGAPTEVESDYNSGILTTSATAVFAGPSGWAGMVAINEAGNEITGSDSLIEGSYNKLHDGNKARSAFDVSYVAGFTLPITCHCGGEVLAGCSLDLFELNECPDGMNNLPGTCRNPNRGNEDARQATEFFRPCENIAYTFPHDDLATIDGHEECSDSITCCIGTACPAHPKQP
ncbi:uncharacterized protein BCR38DRAFT_313602, partial [Pseudomassariella vexata]